MRPLTITIYRSKDGWRWRMKASNGNIVADSAEAYVSERNAKRAAARVASAAIRLAT